MKRGLSVFGENKKGVSVMIGYILLVTFAVVIAAIVYQWLSSYVPQEDIECPDGVGVYISNSQVSSEQLNLTLQNNGRFNISGVYMRYTNDSNQDVATADLSQHINSSTKVSYFEMNPGVGLGAVDENLFAPQQETKLVFDVSSINQIYSVQITPVRVQDENNKLTKVSCKNSRTEEIVELGV